MTLVKRFLLLASMAIAALALTASAASADPVEVMDDAVHCSPVVPHEDGHEVEGGCHLQAISVGDIDLEIDVHPTGGHTQGPLCENDFEVRLDEYGEGYVQHFDIFPGQPGCGVGVRECDETEAHGGGDGPWRIHVEETGPEHEVATVEVCLIIANVGRCEGPVEVELTHDAEDYFASVADGIPCNGNPAVEAEFLGNYVLLNEEEEVVHIEHPVD